MGSGERRAFGPSIAHAISRSSAPPPAPVEAITTIHRPMASVQNIRTLIGNPQQPTSLNHNPMAATVIDQPPIQLGSGAYSVVNRGDSVDTVRERMLQLGLDPNARTSILPQPPPRRAAGDAPMSVQPSARPTAVIGVRPITHLHPNAIVRSAR
jgi:hypothetical protein